MASQSPLVPYSIQIPGGAPQNFLGVAMFLTQFCSIINQWIKQAANAINNSVSTGIQAITGTAPIIVTSSGTSSIVALTTPLPKAFGGTGSSTGITLSG